MYQKKVGALPLTKELITDPAVPYCSERVYDTLCALTKEYPCLRLHSEGKSTLGRKIPVVTLGNGKRKVLFVGTVHSREYLTTGYLLRCMEEFALSTRKNTPYGGFSLRRLFGEFTLYFVPMANPDGADIALSLSRKPRGVNIPQRLFKNNARNINLNANFPFLFEKVPLSRHGGKKPASEAETKFLIDLCEQESFELMISFHTRGGVVFYRDSKNQRVEYDEEIADKLHTVCGLGIMSESSDEASFSGGFENWFRHRFRKPAFCVELVKDENEDFLKSVRNFYESSDFINTRLIIPVSLSVIK